LKYVVIALLLAAVTSARADDAAAKALFDQGKTLFAEGRFGEACNKLEASYQLNKLSGTGGLLGACYEKIGRLASAWSAYRDSAAIAEKQGNGERAAAARASAAELEPKLAWVTIDASAALKTSDVKITIDGVARPPGAFGGPIPVDAGQHLIAATAVERHSWTRTIDIQDGEKQQLAIPALVEDPSRRLALAKRLAEERRIARTRKRVALGLTAAGGVSLGVATGLALLARSTWNHAQELGCNDSGSCTDAAGAREVDRAAQRADIATYVAGGGALLLGAGVFVYLTSPTPRSERELRVVPTVGPGGAGVTLGGRF
jgi:hypothetical protein